jgi:Predicted P-loop-containing kinase
MVTSAPVRLLVITGLSGAGRRTVGHTLEDLGWLVVDNLPPRMLPELIQISRDRSFSQVAVVLDVRSRSEFEAIPAAFAELGRAGIVPQILFLDASDEAIVRRQEGARRPLPLQGTGRLLDGIRKERTMLAGLRASADLVIDTSNLNVHELAGRVSAAFSGEAEPGLQLSLMSFGFKNGLPIDADMVFDVRFLPNPHWVPALRPQTGLAQPVSAYVLGQPDAEPFLQHLLAIIELARPGYLREGKRLAMVAIGCTGGKHRSTAIVEEAARRLRERDIRVQTIHRDLGLE